eukprot:jgi/Botrbrau1/19664/Bobra.0003s0028.1
MAGGRRPVSTTGKDPSQGSSSTNPQNAMNKKNYHFGSCTRSTKCAERKEDLGKLRTLPHELLEHVFPGLPQATIMELSTSSRHCREAAQKAIPRVRAALVDSLKGGCKWTTRAQLHTMTTLLQRFNACRHISTDQPLPLVHTGREIISASGIGPQGIGPPGMVFAPGIPDIDRPQLWEYAPIPVAGMWRHQKLMEQLTYSYCVEWRSGGAGATWLHCYLHFSFGSTARLRFTLNVVGGRVRQKSLFGHCDFCEDVDLLQAILLKFWPTWGSGELILDLPVKLLQECAAIVAGCGNISWMAGSAGQRHLSADTSSTESCIGRECSGIVIRTHPCDEVCRLRR